MGLAGFCVRQRWAGFCACPRWALASPGRRAAGPRWPGRDESRPYLCDIVGTLTHRRMVLLCVRQYWDSDPWDSDPWIGLPFFPLAWIALDVSTGHLDAVFVGQTTVVKSALPYAHVLSGSLPDCTGDCSLEGTNDGGYRTWYGLAKAFNPTATIRESNVRPDQSQHCVEVVRHYHICVWSEVWEVQWLVAPAVPSDGAEGVQAHSPIDDLTEEMTAIVRPDRDEPRTRTSTVAFWMTISCSHVPLSANGAGRLPKIDKKCVWPLRIRTGTDAIHRVQARAALPRIGQGRRGSPAEERPKPERKPSRASAKAQGGAQPRIRHADQARTAMPIKACSDRSTRS